MIAAWLMGSGPDGYWAFDGTKTWQDAGSREGACRTELLQIGDWLKKPRQSARFASTGPQVEPSQLARTARSRN